jgi:hypothetical protein
MSLLCMNAEGNKKGANVVNNKTANIDGLSQISHCYDVFIFDLWGVIHDGITPFQHSVTFCHSRTPLCHSPTPLCHSPTPLCHSPTPLCHSPTPLCHSRVGGNPVIS